MGAKNYEFIIMWLKNVIVVGGFAEFSIVNWRKFAADSRKAFAAAITLGGTVNSFVFP